MTGKGWNHQPTSWLGCWPCKHLPAGPEVPSADRVVMLLESKICQLQEGESSSIGPVLIYVSSEILRAYSSVTRSLCLLKGVNQEAVEEKLLSRVTQTLTNRL